MILVEGKYKLDPRAPPEAGSGGNHWVFKTNDCRKDVEILKAHGVKFKDPAPVEANYGIAAYFTDPDGNHLTLLESSAQPPRKGGRPKANRRGSDDGDRGLPARPTPPPPTRNPLAHAGPPK